MPSCASDCGAPAITWHAARWPRYEDEFGEYEGGALEGSVIPPELESPLTEMQEMELASELLEVTGEQELEQFLSDVFSAVGQAAGNFIRSGSARRSEAS